MDEMSVNSQHAEPLVGGSSHFLVEFDILNDFEGKSKVPKQHVHAQESDETEIAEHMIEGQ
jgi:hypothetical protein